MTAQKKDNKPAAGFAFGRENYMLMIIGITVIFLGFILMQGGGSSNPNVFNPEIFSFRRVTLAPILIITGFIIEIAAILRKTKE